MPRVRSLPPWCVKPLVILSVTLKQLRWKATPRFSTSKPALQRPFANGRRSKGVVRTSLPQRVQCMHTPGHRVCVCVFQRVAFLVNTQAEDLKYEGPSDPA